MYPKNLPMLWWSYSKAAHLWETFLCLPLFIVVRLSGVSAFSYVIYWNYAFNIVVVVFIPVYTLSGFYICPPLQCFPSYFYYLCSHFPNFLYFRFHILQTFHVSNFLDIFAFPIFQIFPYFHFSWYHQSSYFSYFSYFQFSWYSAITYI